MALIKCEECGREISDRANACVHCGCPISQDAGKRVDNSRDDLEVVKQSTNEFFDKNKRSLYVEFDAVVSKKTKESTINNVYIKELGKNIAVLVPNNIEENEKIFKKTDEDKCDLIVFTVKTVSVDPSVKSIAPEKKAKKKSTKGFTIKEIIDNYRPNSFVRFLDGPGPGSIIAMYIAFSIIQKMWNKVTIIALLIIAIPLLLMKMICPFLDVKKYIKKNHIDEAIKNDPDYLNLAILTYNLMPCKRMLRYIKRINTEAGIEIECQLSKK